MTIIRATHAKQDIHSKKILIALESFLVPAHMLHNTIKMEATVLPVHLPFLRELILQVANHVLPQQTFTKEQ